MPHKRLYGCAVFLLMCALLSGCLAVEDLLSAPRPAVETQQLQDKIDTLLNEGKRHSAPLTGEHRQALQMIDLDNDGQNEAVLFLRCESGDGTHQIIIFRIEDGEYRQYLPIEETGDSIHSVTFADLTGDGSLDIIVGWQVGTLRALSVYTISDGIVRPLLLRKPYFGYELMTLGGDAPPALMTIYIDSQAHSMVEMLRLAPDGSSLQTEYTAYLSLSVESLERTRAGRLADGAPALFVTCAFGIEDESGLTDGEVTDVFAYRPGGGLVNVSLNAETGISDFLVRRIRGLTAIDFGGGVISLPRPVVLPRDPRQELDSELLHKIEWVAYNSAGGAETVAYTFHSVARGWYFRFPEGWPEDLTVYRETVEHWDVSVTNTVFSLLEDGGEVAADLFMIVERTYRAETHTVPAGEILLNDGSESRITAKVFPLPPELEMYAMDEAAVLSNFHFMGSGWLE